MTTASVTSKDRFSFALFLALTLHAALILGVGFSSEINTAENISIDVTLSVANDVVEPEEADFIAATNQLGSGTETDILQRPPPIGSVISDGQRRRRHSFVLLSWNRFRTGKQQ